MTREEAIYTLRGLFIPCASDGNKWGCDRNEALDMAIEALQTWKPLKELKQRYYRRPIWCGVRTAVGSIQAVKADDKSVLIRMDWYMQPMTISVHTEKGASRANEQQGIYRRTGERR